MQLKILFEKIAKMGIDNELINYSIATTSLYNINFQNIEDYPVMCLMPYGTHRTTKNIISYSIALYYIDRLNRDGSNEFDILSTSIEVLKSLVNNVRNIKGVVDVSTDYNITNFTDTQRLSDKCAGAFVTLNVDVLNENSCSLADNEVEENTIKLKNQIKYLSIDKNGRYNVTYDEGYNGLKEVEIDVELDTSFYFEEGYNEGRNVGVEEGKQLQKDLLEPITITENGTYNREDGYNEIVVEVPDLNGDYDTGYNDGYNVGDVEGYDRGKTDGYNEGYNVGYNEGEENGVAQAGEIIAETARVLDITENGTYTSQYSDPIYPDTITGVYPDGENFYSLAKVNNVVYNTGIIPNETTKLEFWFEPDKQMDNLDGDWFSIVIDAEIDDYNCFRIRHYHMGTEFSYEFSIKGSRLVYDLIDGINHIEMSYADGLIVNGIKVDDFYQNISSDFNKPFYINGNPIHNLPERTDDGKFGIIKITTNGVENIIIPTEDGFKNITTDEMLEVVYNGIYNYINNNPIIPEGNLIKTVNVNVQPKVNVAEIGLKFGYSTFKKLPEIFDFSYVTDMNNLFFNGRLETLEGIDFSKVTSLYNSFSYCPLKNLDYFNNYPYLTNIEKAFSQTHIEIVPDLNLSNIDNAAEAFGDCNNLIQVGNLNLEKVRNLNLFLKNGNDNRPLTKIGILNVPNVEDMSDFFYYSFSPKTLPNLTEMGGFIGLKCNWNGGMGLDACPNLTYQSCINILNGLADVTELGGRTLKVAQSFIDKLTEEDLQIAIGKGWSIQS